MENQSNRNSFSSEAGEARRNEVTNQTWMQIIVLGSFESGKSSIIQRYIKKEFSQDKKKTKVMDFMAIDKIEENVRMCLWDTPGRMILHPITACFYRQAHGFVILYNVFNRYSFNKVKSWLKIPMSFCQQKVGLVLCGNKCDQEGLRRVSTKEGEQLAEEIGALFFETSAKTGHNVEQAFDAIFHQIINSDQYKHIFKKDEILLNVENKAADEIAPDETVAGETVAGETVADEAVADEAVADEAVADKTVANEAVADVTVADEAVADETVAGEAVADEAVASETVADETVAGEAVASETVADETVADETVADETVAGETVANEAVADVTVADEAVADETVAGETVADETVADVTVADETVTVETVADETVADVTLADVTVTNKVTADEVEMDKNKNIQ